MGAYINVVGTSHPGVWNDNEMLDSDLTEIPGGAVSIQPILEVMKYLHCKCQFVK